MRRPTPISKILAWHRAALAGECPATHDGYPECGWFKRRWVKGGPWVPVRIYLDRDIDPMTGELTRDEVMCIEIEGIQHVDPEEHWTYLTPITRAEFEHLTDYRLRDSRMMDPYRPLDLSLTPTPPQGVF